MNWTRFSEKLLSTIGEKELGTTHQRLVEEYNKIEPLPRNYKASLNDPWCAIYVSAMWHKWQKGWFPYECSCGRMVNLAAKRNKFWAGDKTDGRSGWLMFYDWERDNSPDHVGYVIDVDRVNGRIRALEGNYSNMVKERYISIGDKRIYGFVELEYDDTEIDAAKEWVTRNNIILGDGTPDSWTKPITREQLAVILARYHQAT